MALKICESVEKFIQPYAEQCGLDILDVEYVKKADGMNLTIVIDKEGGITLDDCEKLHRLIDEPLDELDPTEGAAYTLNVSSPGLDRPYKTAHDYEKHIGTASEVSLFAPMEKLGKKFVAILENYDAESGDVTLDAAGKKITINKKDIALIREHIEF